MASQLLGTSSLAPLMVGVHSPNSAPGIRAAGGGTGAATVGSARKPGSKPVLVVNVEGDSSDEDDVGRIKLFAGATAQHSPLGSPWAAAGKQAQQPPPSSRLTRPLGGGGGVALPPAPAASTAVAAGTAGGAQTFSSGRRAISAQTVLRDGGIDDAPTFLSPSARSTLSQADVTGSAASNGAAKPSSLAYATPASPPFPKAVYSQRAQSGPARMTADGMLMPPGTGGGGSGAEALPSTPTSAAKHGRRSIMANIPSTISEEASVQLLQRRATSDLTQQPSTTSSPLRIPAAPQPLPQQQQRGGAMAASPGRGVGPPPSSSSGSGGVHIGSSSPIKGSTFLHLGGAAAAALKRESPAEAAAALGSLLQVKASVDSSLDLSAMREEIGTPTSSRAAAVGDSSTSSPPLISNMFTLMQSTTFPTNTRDRYASSSLSSAAAAASTSVTAAVAGGQQQQQRAAAPPTSQRPAAPADHMSRPRMGSEGPPSSSSSSSAASTGVAAAVMATGVATARAGQGQPSAPRPAAVLVAGAAVGVAGAQKRSSATPPSPGSSKGGGGVRAMSPSRPKAKPNKPTTAPLPAAAAAAVGVMPSVKAMTPSSRTRPLLPPAAALPAAAVAPPQGQSLSAVAKTAAAAAAAPPQGQSLSAVAKTAAAVAAAAASEGPARGTPIVAGLNGRASPNLGQKRPPQSQLQVAAATKGTTPQM